MSGYTHCACRDCMEIAIGEAGKAFCSGCVEAGCPDYQGQEGMSQECQREDAYGADVEEVESDGPTCPLDGGIGVYLGRLGSLEHFRCRACGMDFNRRVQ